MKNSLHQTFRSFIRELVRGHIFRYYYYLKIKDNEFSQDKLRKYENYRFKKLRKALGLKMKISENISSFVEKFPIIRKNDLRNNPKKYESKIYGKFIFNYNRTSGTTGSPLQIKQSLECIHLEEAFSYRQRKIIGYSLFNKIAWIRGDMVVPASRQEPPFWCRDYFMNKLMMSSYHISNSTSPQYIDKLENFDPILIEAYPSSIAALARWLESENRFYNGKNLKGIMTSSEVLTEDMQIIIEKYFQCKVFDWYGQAERVAGIATCELGNKHLLLDYSYVELSEGNKGEVIGTSYNNSATPLVRYATGDSIELDTKKCKCGRIFPLVKKIDGRKDSLIILSNGKEIKFLDHAFKNIPDLIETQIVQKPEDVFIVNIVIGKDFKMKYKKVIMDNLTERLGDVSIVVNICNQIERGNNGKFKFIKVEM